MLAEQDRAAAAGAAGGPGGLAQRRLPAAATVFDRAGDDELVVEWYGGRDGYTHADARGPRGRRRLARSVRRSRSPGSGTTLGVHVAVDGSTRTRDGPRRRAAPVTSRLREVPRFVDPADVVAHGLAARADARHRDRRPARGRREVTAGQTVLVLEAMKMQHTITAPTDGVVTEIAVTVGQQVAAGEVLAVVDPTRRAEQQKERRA